jgi:hypothetical protein
VVSGVRSPGEGDGPAQANAVTRLLGHSTCRARENRPRTRRGTDTPPDGTAESAGAVGAGGPDCTASRARFVVLDVLTPRLA